MQNSTVGTGDAVTGSVAVIGAGLIGRGWAIVFARAGWQVNLYDLHASQLDVARQAIADQLQMLKQHGLCEQPDSLINNIHYKTDLEAALSGADYVQECGPEVLEAKKKLYSEMDELALESTILASSTSGLMASEFAAHLSGRRRALVVHPVNPPHLVPLVEISPAEWTDPAVTQGARQIMSSVGQTPITVEKEISGFILNRLQGALLNEVLRLTQGGYVSAEDIDKAVCDGLGLRWSFMGPLETIDLNAPEGLADYAARYGAMYHAMAETQSSPPDWHESSVAELHDARRERLDSRDIARRQNWRDNRLAALIAHKSKQEN
ncbi:3-hydroxyacyl-CoA dehydrogenase [Chromatiales bacterium (ex Bugula neritina AB1)]|nr:3-hydroxyacyl-CoA dehydrogenase [Chromatiales bacterium (ex Bugula neritina AB1)]